MPVGALPVKKLESNLGALFQRCAGGARKPKPVVWFASQKLAQKMSLREVQNNLAGPTGENVLWQLGKVERRGSRLTRYQDGITARVRESMSLFNRIASIRDLRLRRR